MEWCGSRCCGLERTDFKEFLLWEGLVVLERTDFEQFLLWRGEEVGVVVLKETDFEQFLLWDGVVVLKELILNSFYCGRVWWS